MALFLPYAAGLSLNQLNPVISRMLGSFLEEGSISVLNYANRIVQLPLGLFVIAISQAVLPRLSRAQNPVECATIIGEAVRFALFIVAPATLGLILISDEFVHLIFVRGAFGAQAWHATSRALTLSLYGLPGMAFSTVVMRGLYALSLPRAAFNTTLFSVSCTALLSAILMRPMGYGGLALAPSVAFTLSGFLGMYFIFRHLGRTWDGVLTASFGKTLWRRARNFLYPLLLMAVLTVVCRSLFPYNPAASLLSRIFWCMALLFLGGGAYVAATLLMKCEEWKWIAEALSRKKAPSADKSGNEDRTAKEDKR